ncbi:MAG: AMP-binding protein [Bacteroidales bacterium]|nr:AMP-binding protein [Bacteroidales bacterium]
MRNDSLNKLFESSIREHWNSPALSNCEGETLLYSDVGRHTVMLQHLFAGCGVEPGSRVAICSRNQAAWGVAFLAVMSAGAVPVPILSDFRPGSIHYLVNHSESKLLFAGSAILEELDPARMPDLAAIIRIEDFEVVHTSNSDISGRLAAALREFHRKYPRGVAPEDVVFHKDSPEDLALINYTSGTSGFAKGVMLPYRSLLFNIELIHRVAPQLDCNSNVVSMLPLAHMYGMTMDFIFEMTIGAHVHFLMRPPSPTVIKETFARIRPDIIMTVPLVIEKICRKVMAETGCTPEAENLTQEQKKKACDALTTIFGGRFSEVMVGGAPMNRQIEDFLAAIGFRYTVGSGMTECGPLVSLSSCKEIKPHTCGKRAFYSDIRIDSPDAANIPGEVYIRGGNLFLGYLKMPERTAEVLSADGWFRTGDIGTLDADGFLSLRGRCTSMILNSAGQNIFPEEIESSINTLPYVQESLVVADGNRLVALIVPDRESAAAAGLAGETLNRALKDEVMTLNGELPTYCNIAQVEVREQEFEKTPKNSIKRYLYDRQTKTI